MIAVVILDGASASFYLTVPVCNLQMRTHLVSYTYMLCAFKFSTIFHLNMKNDTKLLRLNNEFIVKRNEMLFVQRQKKCGSL